MFSNKFEIQVQPASFFATQVAEQITRDTHYFCAAYDPEGKLTCGLTERGKPLIRVFQDKLQATGTPWKATFILTSHKFFF